MPGTLLLRIGFRTLLIGGLLVVLASCVGTGSGPVSVSGSGAQESTGSSGSAGSAATASAARPGSPSTSSSSASGVPLPVDPVCSHTAPTITARTGEHPRPVCLRVGQSLTITTAASSTQPWQPMTSSNAAVLACTSHPADQGALTAVCKALRPGIVAVSTTTAPFAGDPHGPPQYTWSLIIEVQPAS
jgi:hypothetical protein